MNRPVPIPRGPGQESVWNYPRPPRAEPTPKEVIVTLGGEVICKTTEVVRVLETSHPPVYYLPLKDFRHGALRPIAGAKSFCEWKGVARYFDVVGGGQIRPKAGWSYPEPSTPEMHLIRGFVALYARLMDSCTVNGELVIPQPGLFYGGWITRDVVGPFKGEPGTEFW
jgi:uncharacterized protein (DUF427 family)